MVIRNRSRPVQVILIRDSSASSYGLEPWSPTDTTAPAAQVIERYAATQTVEVVVEDS